MQVLHHLRGGAGGERYVGAGTRGSIYSVVSGVAEIQARVVQSFAG